jgi:hypothetical protein
MVSLQYADTQRRDDATCWKPELETCQPDCNGSNGFSPRTEALHSAAEQLLFQACLDRMLAQPNLEQAWPDIGPVNSVDRFTVVRKPDATVGREVNANFIMLVRLYSQEDLIKFGEALLQALSFFCGSIVFKGRVQGFQQGFGSDVP